MQYIKRISLLLRNIHTRTRTYIYKDKYKCYLCSLFARLFAACCCRVFCRLHYRQITTTTKVQCYTRFSPPPQMYDLSLPCSCVLCRVSCSCVGVSGYCLSVDISYICLIVFYVQDTIKIVLCYCVLI